MADVLVILLFIHSAMGTFRVADAFVILLLIHNLSNVFIITFNDYFLQYYIIVEKTIEIKDLQINTRY